MYFRTGITNSKYHARLYHFHRVPCPFGYLPIQHYLLLLNHMDIVILRVLSLLHQFVLVAKLDACRVGATRTYIQHMHLFWCPIVHIYVWKMSIIDVLFVWKILFHCQQGHYGWAYSRLGDAPLYVAQLQYRSAPIPPLGWGYKIIVSLLLPVKGLLLCVLSTHYYLRIKSNSCALSHPCWLWWTHWLSCRSLGISRLFGCCHPVPHTPRPPICRMGYPYTYPATIV